MHVRKTKILVSIIVIGLLIGTFAYGFSTLNASAQTQARRGVQRILVLDSLTKGVNIATSTVFAAFFTFEFAPLGTFINVSNVHINAIFKNTAISSYSVEYQIGPDVPNGVILSQSISENPGTTSDWVRATICNFTNTLLAPGINEIMVYDSGMSGNYILYRLELLVEYYYFP